MRHITFFIAIALLSCNKDSEPPVYSATFTLYSQQTPYTFAYSDVSGDHIETVTTQNYTKTFDVPDSEMQRLMGIDNIGTAYPDSLYVRADINGKHVERSYYFNCACDAQLYVQLSQAQ